jgi:integrase
VATQKRRGKGEGSLYQRKRDQRWVACITLEDGSRKEMYRKTRQEAHKALQQMLGELEQGTLALGPQQTVAHFLEYWLEDVHRQTLRISSYVEYRRALNNHILPTLGHIRLQKLSIQQVEAFYARLSREGLAAKTISGIHGVLRKALAHAVYLNLISRNVCDIVNKSLPRKERQEVRILTKEQAQALLQHLRGRYQLEALFTLALLTGMRRGEIAALRWRDISFAEKYLLVSRSARRTGGSFGLVISDPKSVSSRRKISLSPFLLEVLQHHQRQQQDMRRSAGEAWQDNDLVFCNRHGGLINPDTLRVWFKGALKEAGLPSMRFHDLRHSAATLLLVMGVHVKVVQELLGHSNILITLNTYSHVLPSLHEQAMDELSTLFAYEKTEGGQGQEIDQNEIP